VPAVYMRGGTSKGVFFGRDDLPSDHARRDAVLLRAIGSPDPYGKHTDGMGGATSSTSKVVLISKSDRDDCDVDYLFGQVLIDQPQVDWSGSCGNLTAAVGPYAIRQGLVQNVPHDGLATVRIWQANVHKKILAHVPMCGGEVQELGDFELDGVTFPAAEIGLDFLDPGATGAMLPTGAVLDRISVPGLGEIEMTLLNAGNPTVFVDAAALGLRGTELQGDVNNDGDLLQRCEAVRAHAAVAMGLAESPAHASEHRQHTPKLAFVGLPAAYTASSGKAIAEGDTDVLIRILSMGKLHHAMTGTGAVAIATAASIPGSIVSRALGGPRGNLRFGHPSGVLKVGAAAAQGPKGWEVSSVAMSRSARRLMEGWVLVPADAGLGA